MTTDFTVSSAGWEPAYLALHRAGELQRRADLAVARLGSCELCPRRCRDNRLGGETGTCKVGRLAQLASFGPHHGEEACLRGRRGSGTIFFAHCSLRCVFCQNADISQGPDGEPVTPDRLADIFLALQAAGCHNLNLVTPSHVVPQILEALPLAVDGGLRLPLVYNTSGYDAVETLQLLDGVVDIYMPDFKVWDTRLALRLLAARDYPAAARRAIREMHRQVGPLRLDENGLARRGLLVRHLVLPGGAADSAAILRFLAHEVSPHTYVNLMDQYRPAHRAAQGQFPEINRPVTPDEFDAALAAALNAGLHRLDERRILK